MDFLIVGIVGIVEAAAALAAMFFISSGGHDNSGAALEAIKAQVAEREKLLARVKSTLEGMGSKRELSSKVKEYRIYRETLKTERGRVTITQAELETVEGRLRELEEIERELEASGLETKEELNILQKKEKELAAKNEALKAQIAESTKNIDQLLSELKLNAEATERVQGLKLELLQTQEKIDTLLIEIEQGNEQYFQMKKRYDALDIEYAQLFEKFSEAEGSSAS